MKQNNRLNEFASRFERLSGKVYRCSNCSEVISVIKQIIAQRTQGRCYLTEEALEFIRAQDGGTLLEQEIIRSAQMYNPEDNKNGLEILKEADVGVTTADYGVAETGCLVEIAYPESTKLLSSLSRVNIVLLKATSILGKLQELAPILRAILSKEDKPTITLISGPSRTSDIEMKSVLGVHGPHEVHALILE